MSQHDQTRNGGRPSDQVDPSKIVQPKDDDKGRHSGASGQDSGVDPNDEKK